MINRWAWVFLAPTLILTLVFSAYPMVMSWWYSFLDWTGFTKEGDFIGLGNYAELIHDELFWAAFGRSFLFMAVGTPLQMGISLIFALILNDQLLKWAPAFRAMIFLPVVTSAAVVGVVMTFVLGAYRGPVNEVLLTLQLIPKPIHFLSNPDLALWSVLGVHVWKALGMTMIYWLAALQTVPASYYDAAKVDGAGRFRIVKNITVPILLPFTLLILVLTAKGNLHTFAIIQAMTQGGPYFASQVIEVYIYQTAFEATDLGGVPRLGYASAAGCFFGLLTLVITLVQVAVVRRANQIRGELVRAGDR